VVYTVREAAATIGLDPEGATAVVQGFGNVGGASARLLAKAGFKVIAVSDVYGGVINEAGIDVDRLTAHVNETGSVVGAPGTDPISGAELLTLKCDVLVPAAMEKQLTGQNADQVRAKMIVEAANGPTTPEADRVFRDRGIFVVPDILANAGGVTVSYFEWVQDLMAFFWSEEEINSRLEQVMVRSFRGVKKMSEDYQVDMRTAANMVAIKKVADATRIRGIYP
jgi:glutamate dehydrogenase/leucine dehydrogenase